MSKVELMLAKAGKTPLTNKEVWSGYWMEPKLDGMRAAVIKTGDEVTIYGRSWLEYQEHVPHLVEIFKSVTFDFHLDGELCYIKEIQPVLYNGSNWGIPVVDFNQTMRIMGSLPEHAIIKQEEVGSISFVAFDIINTEATYKDRTYELGNIITQINSEYVLRTPVFFNWTPELYTTLEPFCEGIMMKNTESLYKGGRPNKTMYKIKKEETYDVVVYEAYEGTGKHQGRLGGLKFGAYLPSGEFKKVGKAGGGFSDAEREEIWNNFSTYNGRVIEIKCNETVGSGEYRTPRHPNFLHFRNDKRSEECLMEQFKNE